MKRILLILVVLITFVFTATGCDERPTSADLAREQLEVQRKELEVQRAADKLEARRERQLFWAEFWVTVRPILVVGTAVIVMIVLIASAWFLYEAIDTYSINKRQTQIKAGSELAYFPRRNAVLMAQRLLRPLAVLKPGHEHAPKMAAGDERMQLAVSMGQQAVSAKGAESPAVMLQSASKPAQLPAGTQQLRVVAPDDEVVSPWVEDIQGQLLASGEQEVGT